jgi:type I restriction enzyme S subunit
MNDGLTAADREKLVGLLSRFPKLEKVVLFGSRAMGTYSPASDIDLALYGDGLTLQDVARLASEIEECELPVEVDLIRYDTITSEPLKEHIARYGKGFYEKSRSISKSLGIASEWLDVKVGEIAAPVRNAIVGGPFGSNLVSKDYVNFGIPVIRGQNMGGRWIGGDFVFVTKEKASILEANLARPGDVVFTQRGTLGQVSVVPSEGTDLFLLSQSQMKLTPDPAKVDALYLYYVFTSQEQQEYIRLNAVQVGVPHTNLGFLKQTPLRLPPLEVQKSVASILGALDDKIEENRRINETLEAMARALFKDWFVDFGPTRAKAEGRTPYLAPDLWSLFPYLLNEAGIPDGWNVRPLAEFFSIICGGTPKTAVDKFWNGDIPWFSVVDTPPTGSLFVFDTEKSITKSGLESSSARLIPAGTTIISARGTVGNLAIAAQDMAFNQSCYALHGDGAVGDCFVFLAAQQMVVQLQLMAHGSVFSTITRTTFDAISLPMPPDTVLLRFEYVVDPIFAKIKANVAENCTLAKTRDLLLPKLLSGEIRIREAEERVNAAL